MALAQISITALPYTPATTTFNDYNPSNAQNASSTIPQGWTVTSSAYQGRGTGTNNAGGAYGFGSGSDFSLGALRSSSASTITYAVSFTNSSGTTITSLTISWNYEQWRFSNTSGWDLSGTGALATNTTVNSADYTGLSNGTSGTVQSSPRTLTLTGLSIANNTTFGLSWVTTDATGSDNGIAIDDFSISAQGATPPTLNVTTLPSFGASNCINTPTSPQTFTITGSNLTGNVTVNAVTNLTYATTANGTYQPSLTLSPSSGSLNQQVFVRWTPTTTGILSSNISVSSVGATTQNVATSGTAINTSPSVTSEPAASVLINNAILQASNVAANCQSIIDYGFEYSTTQNFTPGTGTPVSASNLANGSYSLFVSGLTAGTTYYYRAVVNRTGTSIYGAQVSFTTATNSANIAPSTNALSGFQYVEGYGPSPAQSFTVSAANLNPTNGSLLITGTNNFEVSSTSATAGFGSVTTLPYSGSNTLVNNTVWVRLKSGLAVGSYSSESISISGGGASNSISVSGTVMAPTVVLALAGATNHGSACVNSPATPITYTITNNGNATATNVLVTSNNPEFVVSGLSAATIAANGTANFTVTFTPTASGNRTAALSITADAPASALNASLSGNGAITLPTVTNSAALNITSATATLPGTISGSFCGAVTAYGFQWGTSPTLTGATQSAATNLSTGNFSSSLSGLSPLTQYYYRAYAVTANGTALAGTISSFQTSFAGTANSASALWTFSSGDSSSATSSPVNGVTLGSFSIGNSFGTVATPITNASTSSGYTGASGTFNIGNAVDNSVTDLTNASNAPYAQVSLTPTSGAYFAITGISFGSRSTTTGAKNFTVRSSLDNYSTNLATGAIPNNSSWNTYANPSFTQTSYTTQPITIRIYGYNGASNAGTGTINWRLDDISIQMSIVATLSASALSAFGTVCTNTSNVNTFTLTGAGLTSSSVTVGPLSGYSFATTANGTFQNTLNLTPNNGSINQTVFVRFSPTAAQTFNGNIPVSGGGASTINVVASGTGIVAPSIIPSVTNATCSNASNGAINLTVTGVSNPTYNWSNNATTQNISNLAAGNYSVAVTANGCTTNSGNITVGSNATAVTPSVSITSNATNNTICAGTSVTFTANPTNGGTPSYQWRLNGTNVPGATNATFTTTTLNNNDAVSVLMTSSLSCVTSATATSSSIVTTVNAYPVVTPSVTNATCSNASNGAINLTVTGVSNPTYNWSNNATTQNISNLAAGTYSVAVTANGCTTNSGNITVGSNATPVTPSVSIVSDAANNTICAGTSVTFTATPTNGGNAPTFEWFVNSTSQGAASTLKTFTTATLNNNDAVTVVMTPDAATVCANPTTTTSPAISTSVTPAPTTTLTPSGPTTFNCGDNVTISLNNTHANYTYQWQRNGTDINGATNASYVATLVGDYRVVITSPICGAPVTSDVTTVNVNTPNLAVSASSGGYICVPSGQTVVLSGTATPNFTYQWVREGVDTFVANGATTTSFTAVRGGTYNLRVSGCGATFNSADLNVVSIPTPSNLSVSASGPLAIDCGGSVTLTAPATPTTGIWAYTYQWQNNQQDIAGETNMTYTATAPGSYRVKVINMNCTQGFSATSVVSYATPNLNVSVSSTNPICVPSNGSVTLTGNPTPGATYQWELGGVAISGATNTTYVATAPGAYRMLITTACSSWRTSPRNVTAIANPIITVTAGGSLAIACNTGSVTLNAVSNAGYTYQWERNGNIINNATNASYTATEAGAYRVMITNQGCTQLYTATQNVTNLTPAVTVSASATSICTQTSGTTTLTATNLAGHSYQWQRSNANIPGATNASYVASQTGTYRVSVTNSCGTYNLGTTAISAIPAAPATITPSTAQTIPANGSVQLAVSSSPTYTYQWQRNNGNIAGATNANYTATQAGSYRAIITNQNCTQRITNSVVVSLSSGARAVAAVSETPITVYPNPSSGIFSIATEADVNVTVKDIQGRLVLSVKHASQIDLTNEASGLYLMQVMDQEGKLLQTVRLSKD